MWLAQQKSSNPSLENEAEAEDGPAWLEAAQRMFLTAIRLDPALGAAHRDLAVLLLQLQSARPHSVHPRLRKLRALRHATNAAMLERAAAVGNSDWWLVGPQAPTEVDINCALFHTLRT